MAPLKSILVMADRSADAQVALQKAFVIARHFDAQIELFACDAEQPWVARSPGRAAEGAHAAAARSVETRRFLDALRGMIVVDDLQIRAGEDCDGPLHEGLPRRVRAAGHHLVVKRLPAREGRRRPALSAADWQVIRACPVPILLTRGRLWQPLPKFVAKVDEPAAGDVVEAARYLADGCHGALEVVNEGPAEPHRADGPPSGGASLVTRPTRHEIDVVVLRACGPHPDVDVAREVATERIVEQLDCDVLLMPRTAAPH